jgi:hypothetical protein
LRRCNRAKLAAEPAAEIDGEEGSFCEGEGELLATDAVVLALTAVSFNGNKPRCCEAGNDRLLELLGLAREPEPEGLLFINLVSEGGVWYPTED